MDLSSICAGWILVLVACEALRLSIEAHRALRSAAALGGFFGGWALPIPRSASAWTTWTDRAELARRASVQARQAARAYGVSVDPEPTRRWVDQS